MESHEKNKRREPTFVDEKAIKNIKKIKYRGRHSKFEMKYCKMLIEHCATGGHMNDFCTVIGVAQSTIYLWASQKNDDGSFKYPEFVEAKKTAEAYAHRYWSEVGRRGIIGGLRGFNASAWIFLMKNKFQWTDRHDLTSSNDPIAVPENKFVLEFVNADQDSDACKA